MPSIFVHIVSWNSRQYILPCLDSILNQEGMKVGENLFITVRDNSSKDDTCKLILEKYNYRVTLNQNSLNLGFCAAHNQGFLEFIEGKSDYILVLNPDTKLEKNFLLEFISVVDRNKQAGIFTPKLLRADDNLNCTNPKIIDAAGMNLDNSLRHFDIGSQEVDKGQYEIEGEVFGGTGAALILSRDAVRKLELVGAKFNKDLFLVYPFLDRDFHKRLQIFDEAFFAYREDAELCWRAGNLGINTIYCPSVIGFHRRVVLPERRKDLPKLLNLYSVRNRFLMQIVNYSFRKMPMAFFPGLLLRNLLVIFGVLFTEQASLSGLTDLLKLWRRACERRALLIAKGKNA
ncbi:MAG: glycosyltransferase family 2 protein [bacterium]|nr:glycosyltransferase family 2 protein [bacterium]